MIATDLSNGNCACAAIAPGAGVGLHHARRATSRLKVQAQQLAACKVGVTHSLAALASMRAFMASTDASASASACSCQVSSVVVAIVAAVAAVTITAAGVDCIVF